MSELTIEAKTEKLDEVLAFVDGELEKLDCPMKVQMQLDVAVEELFVNIASYAYAPGEGMATIRFESEDGGGTAASPLLMKGFPITRLKSPIRIRH